MTDRFDHEKLDVYQLSVEFLALADRVAATFPGGRAYLGDQLRRASLSISLNIAEGAGEFSPKEKSRFYRMAKRSATECAACLDACQRLKLIDSITYDEGRELLLRIVAMLVKLAQQHGS
jgi:four helix bundle protein